jgi:sugar lactone lactonase YvrE
VRRRRFLTCAMAAVWAGCTPPKTARQPLRLWGGHGLRPGEFAKPRAISVRPLPTGHEVFVIDTTGRVQIFSASGDFLRQWDMPDASNGTPTAVTFAKDRVIIPDTHWSQIAEYTFEGEELKRWGHFGTEQDAFIYPTGVALGPQGEYFFSEYGEGAHRIHVFDADQKFLRQWGGFGEAPGEVNRPMSIALSPAGMVWVADTANHRVQGFDFEGTLQHVIDGAGTVLDSIKYPYDLDVAADGSLLVAEYGANRVSRFSATGAYMAAYGMPGRLPGEFNAPRGVAVSPDGIVYIADTDNHRIQAFPMEEIL